MTVTRRPDPLLDPSDREAFVRMLRDGFERRRDASDLDVWDWVQVFSVRRHTVRALSGVMRVRWRRLPGHRQRAVIDWKRNVRSRVCAPISNMWKSTMSNRSLANASIVPSSAEGEEPLRVVPVVLVDAFGGGLGAPVDADEDQAVRTHDARDLTECSGEVRVRDVQQRVDRPDGVEARRREARDAARPSTCASRPFAAQRATISGVRSVATTSRPASRKKTLSWPVPAPTSSSRSAPAATSRSRKACRARPASTGTCPSSRAHRRCARTRREAEQ